MMSIVVVCNFAALYLLVFERYTFMFDVELFKVEVCRAKNFGGGITTNQWLQYGI